MLQTHSRHHIETASYYLHCTLSAFLMCLIWYIMRLYIWCACCSWCVWCVRCTVLAGFDVCEGMSPWMCFTIMAMILLCSLGLLYPAFWYIMRDMLIRKTKITNDFGSCSNISGFVATTNSNETSDCFDKLLFESTTIGETTSKRIQHEIFVRTSHSHQILSIKWRKKKKPLTQKASRKSVNFLQCPTKKE